MCILFLICSVLLGERILRLPNTTANRVFRKHRAEPKAKSVISSIQLHLEKIFPSDEYERVPFLMGKHHNSSYDNICNLKILPDTLENDEEVSKITKNKQYVGFADGSVLESQNYTCAENRSGAAYVIENQGSGVADVTQISTGRVQHSYGSESTGLAALSIDLAQRIVDEDNEGCEVALFTDCQSRIKSLNTLKMEEILDKDTVGAVNGLCSVALVTLAHVRAHAGIYYNEVCDGNAKTAAGLSANDKMHYSYSAAKARIQHILSKNRIECLINYALENPYGKTAQAAALTKNFSRNATIKKDIPRHDGVLANCIEINHCPAVYPEPPWSVNATSKCQFCRGKGGAVHFLINCPKLRVIRKKCWGNILSVDDIISSPENIASYIRAVSAFCLESGVATWQEISKKIKNNNSYTNHNDNNDIENSSVSSINDTDEQDTREPGVGGSEVNEGEWLELVTRGRYMTVPISGAN